MEITLHEVESRGGRKVVAPRRPPTRLLWIPPATKAPPGESVSLSVVIPTYNERANLPELLRRLGPVLEAAVGEDYEVIVVDDDSPDGTWELAQHLTSRHPHLRVLRRTGEKGLSTAVIRGWQSARGDVLGVLDGDLQHPPEILAALWNGIDRGADLAVGSRHLAGGGAGAWSALRRLLSAFARLLALTLLPSAARRLTDPMSGCFLVRRSAVAGRRLHPLGYKILLEVLVRGAIHTIHEGRYVFQERRRGASKATLRVHVEYLAHLLRLRLSTAGLPRFLRFAAVGLLGVGIDMGLLYALGDPRALGLDLTVGKLAAAELAIVHNFLWNDAITFSDLVSEARGGPGKGERFVRFNAVCGVGLLASVALLHAQTGLLGVDRYVANAFTIAVVALWNYHMCLRLGWRAGRPEAAASARSPA